jgi:glutaredoxin
MVQTIGTGSKLMFRILVAAILFLMTFSAVNAEIYRHVDKSGQVIFSDRPMPAQKSETVKLPRINSIAGPADISSPEKSDSSSDKKDDRIVMYSTQWCGVCKRAKQYFRAYDVAFEERDIERNIKAKLEFDRLQGKGVPLFLMGETRMAGFDKHYFDQRYRKR